MNTKTVMAVYDARSEAQSAVQALLERGFTEAEVSLISHAGDGEEGLEPLQEDEQHTASQGAATGGVLGGLAGLLLGIGFLTVPGLGPLVVAGPIASTLMGAVGGAVAGGFMGVLMDFGVPEDDAHIYTEAVRRGGTIVAVTAPPERTESVAATLGEFGPVDVLQRSLEWREQGWSHVNPHQEAEVLDSTEGDEPSPFIASTPSI